MFWNQYCISWQRITAFCLFFFFCKGVNVCTVFEGNLTPSLYKPPHTLDSTSRYSYQVPVVRHTLSANFTRFGCNRNKYKPAVGAGRSEKALYCLLIIFLDSSGINLRYFCNLKEQNCFGPLVSFHR